ncbi:MAG: porin family protein [Bacteroidota bacterium]
MRKLSLLTIVGLFVTVNAFSQNTDVPVDNFRFGLHFSPNIGWEKPDNTGVTKDGGLIGFGFGLMAEFSLSQRYSFLTGLNVTRISSGKKYSFGPLLPDFTTDLTQQYVEIPLALKLKTNEIGYLTYFGKFGITPGYRIKSKLESNAAAFADPNYIDETQPIRLGLLIGIGTEFNISGATNLMVGVDFNNGFTNIYSKKAGNDVLGNRLRSVNNYISLNLGVFF